MPLPGNGHTLAKIVQKLDDHVVNQDKQFADVEKRLDLLDVEVRSLVTERGNKSMAVLKMVLPILVSVLIVAGGWIWGLSRQESAIADLQSGRYENKGNIQMLQQQMQDGIVKNAVRDEQYKQILQKLDEIQKQLKKR
jgi:Tfp pilus assembly protein PilO